VKERSGKCVKKNKCADAGAPAGHPCCCDKDGKKQMLGQSECTKGGAGKCVKKDQCK
jgi:hypothetical protein